jgi:hypothetical protein
MVRSVTISHAGVCRGGNNPPRGRYHRKLDVLLQAYALGLNRSGLRDVSQCDNRKASAVGPLRYVNRHTPGPGGAGLFGAFQGLKYASEATKRAAAATTAFVLSSCGRSSISITTTAGAVSSCGRPLGSGSRGLRRETGTRPRHRQPSRSPCPRCAPGRPPSRPPSSRRSRGPRRTRLPP